MYVMAKGKSKVMEVSTKECRRLFIKFLLKNNCLKKYIACYNADKETNLRPEEVIDRTIAKLSETAHYYNGGRLMSIFEFGDISFHWYNHSVIYCMRDKFQIENGPHYWADICDKFRNEYCDYKLIDFSNAEYFI
jgi:hypothetical protein